MRIPVTAVLCCACLLASPAAVIADGAGAQPCAPGYWRQPDPPPAHAFKHQFELSPLGAQASFAAARALLLKLGAVIVEETPARSLQFTASPAVAAAFYKEFRKSAPLTRYHLLSELDPGECAAAAKKAARLEAGLAGNSAGLEKLPQTRALLQQRLSGLKEFGRACEKAAGSAIGTLFLSRERLDE